MCLAAKFIGDLMTDMCEVGNTSVADLCNRISYAHSRACESDNARSEACTALAATCHRSLRVALSTPSIAFW